MQTFSSVDLQKRTGDVQRAASKGPIAITVHGTPRTVMLPIEQFKELSSRVAGRLFDNTLGKINSKMDQFSQEDTQAIMERANIAIPRTNKALTALDALDIKAWVIGSLAHGNFDAYSDVDFVVDITPSRSHMVFRMIEEAMKGFPFDLVHFDQIPENEIDLFMKDALDAPSFRAHFSQVMQP